MNFVLNKIRNYKRLLRYFMPRNDSRILGFLLIVFKKTLLNLISVEVLSITKCFSR
jgi:hypothetical protein